MRMVKQAFVSSSLVLPLCSWSSCHMCHIPAPALYGAPFSLKMCSRPTPQGPLWLIFLIRSNHTDLLVLLNMPNKPQLDICTRPGRGLGLHISFSSLTPLFKIAAPETLSRHAVSYVSPFLGPLPIPLPNLFLLSGTKLHMSRDMFPIGSPTTWHITVLQTIFVKWMN